MIQKFKSVFNLFSFLLFNFFIFFFLYVFEFFEIRMNHAISFFYIFRRLVLPFKKKTKQKTQQQNLNQTKETI
jgi:hypothetical protein